MINLVGIAHRNDKSSILRLTRSFWVLLLHF